METRRIGSLEVSVVGLGCNNFGGRLDEGRTRRVVDEALDAGITFLDTADIYGGTRSEEYLGRILEGRRDRVVLASKFGMRVDDARPGGADPAYIHRAVEDSLRRLRTDHIDLYQLHQPDDATPIEDTLAALDDLVRAGKVREIGCSNLNAKQLRAAQEAGHPDAARFVSVQNELNLLDRRDLDDGLAEATGLGMAYIPFFPLASGLLTGKYRRGEPLPEGTRIAGWGEGSRRWGLDRGHLRSDRDADGLRRVAWTHPSRAGLRVAARAAAGSLGDRGGHLTRAGPRERGRGRVDAGRRRPRGVGCRLLTWRLQARDRRADADG